MASDSQAHSPADAKDRHARFVAVGLLLVAFMYGVKASTHFVSPATAGLLDYLITALAAGTILFILPVVAYKFFRLDGEGRAEYFSEESFVAHVFRRAAGVAATTAVITLMVLESVAEKLASVPSDFYPQVALALTLGAYAITLLVLNRDPGTDDSYA